MSPEKRRIVTYRERGRIQAVIMGIASIIMLTFGIYFAATVSNWIVLALSIVFTICTVVFYFHNERIHRGEP